MRRPGEEGGAAARWEEIESVFIAALEREERERAAFLDQTCRNDLELRREVEALLEGHGEGRALDIEDRLLGGETETSRPWTGKDTLVGRRIGSYRVLDAIGRGGMGDVYLAERDDEQYRQQVALKLVRLGLQTTEIAQRFRAERQILARLVHPNICRLLDGGVTDDGRPYLVMEHVEGQPITEFCDRRRLPVEDRLRLFCTVCGAVQFAHRNLVVHRDVKPSNVLVTERGEVKLLDFGIAKLLDHEAAEMSLLLTHTASRVMTPEYAAPEQVSGGAITTATDVYALGVLLYELLTGRRPHRFASRAPAEIERIVCGEPVAWPSNVVARREQIELPGGRTEVATAEEVCAERGTDPTHLRRLLRGDLDNIVMMALRKEPERRYGSAEQLAEDVDRYLRNRPVIARKDTLGYRARKFVRRNRVGVAVAAGVFALVVGFAGAVTMQARELARQRDRASLEASTATQVTDFLEELFEAPDPYKTSAEHGETPTLDVLLARGVEKVRRELGGQPAVQARLLDVLGGVFRNLGDLERARPLLEEAVEVQRRATGGDGAVAGSEELAESLNDLAFLLLDLRAHDEAETVLREAQHLGEEGGHRNALYNTLKALGHLMQGRGELDAAEAFYRQALALSRELLEEGHPEIAGGMVNLATVLIRKADFDAAEPLLREALEVQRRAYGPEHPLVATSLNNLGYLLLEKGEVDEAVQRHRESLVLRRQVFEAPHPQIATSLNNLAGALLKQGDLDGAREHYRESLVMRRQLYGDEHPAVATALNNLSEVEGRSGHVAEAGRLLHESRDILRRAVGEDHLTFATATANLASNLHQQGEHEAAVELFRDALAIQEAKLPAGHPLTARTRMDLGRCLTELASYDEAEDLLHASYQVFEQTREEQTTSWTQVLERLATLHRAKGEPDQAARYESLLPQS